ncbi:MAG TPA: hypothetical protein VLX58_15020 [Bryobacteraceae bacterium]|nr:hypothetical protein [Bryobacteraceae bacterium]
MSAGIIRSGQDQPPVVNSPSGWVARFPTARDALLLLVLIIGFFWKLVLTKQYTFLEAPDVANQVLPWLQVQAAALRQGTLALWDSYLFGGQSLIGQVQPAAASPITYLLLLAPLKDGHLRPEFVHYWFVLIHYLAALFAYFFFRDTGCRRAAAVTGGLFFGIAGFVGNTTWPQILVCAIWTPLVFLFLLRSLAGRRPIGSAALAGLFLGLSWLSGHHQVPLFISLAVAGALSAFAVRRGAWRAVSLRWAVLFTCALLIAAVQILPALEYGHQAVRWLGAGPPVDWSTKVPYAVHEAQALNPADLIYFVLPGGGSGMSNPVAGITALSLVVLAVALTLNRPLTRLFLWLAIGGLLFCLARDNVFHGIAYALIPFLDKARSPIMALSVVHFALSGLVALGMDQFLKGSETLWLRRLALGVLAAAAVLFTVGVFGPGRCAAVGFFASLLAAVYWLRTRGRLGVAASAALVCALLMLELGNTTGANYVDRKGPDSLVLPRLMGGTSDIAAFLQRQPGPLRAEFRYEDMLFNFGDWYGIETMSGFLPSVPKAVYKLTWWNPAVLRLYGVGYAIGRTPLRDGQREIFAGASGLKVFANPETYPRAWTVHAADRIRDPDEALRLITNELTDLRSRALLNEPVPPLESCQAQDEVSRVRELPQSVEISVNMACSGLLVIADNAAPGWSADVDGAPSKIYTVDLTLRGIAAERGPHQITMRYRPGSVLVGFWLTIAGLLVTAALSLRAEPAGKAVFPLRG